jgi:DNA-directed RNA polymerase specialized sigma24 family protein
MSQDDSFADLMARLRVRDADAATAVFNHFAGRLVELARQRMDERLRRKVDPEDVIQSVFRSFFARQARGEFDVGSWPELWSLLVVITVRKCGGSLDYFFAGRRDVRQEVTPNSMGDAAPGWQAVASDPTPAEVVAFGDLLEELMRGLQARGRQILTLSLQGYTVPEIKSQVGCSRRTVFRVLDQVKQRLQRLQGDALTS